MDTTKMWKRAAAIVVFALMGSGATGCIAAYEEDSFDDGDFDDGDFDDGDFDEEPIEEATEGLAAHEDVYLHLTAQCSDGNSDPLSDPQPDPWHARRLPIAPEQESEEGDDGAELMEPQPDPWHADTATSEGAGHEQNARDGE